MLKGGSPIRVLIADDHAVLRAGLRALLQTQEDLEVVGEAEDGYQALEQAERLSPDVLLLDVSMPRMGGLEVIRRLKERAPQIRILILSQHADLSYILKGIQEGADGYILKRSAADVLLEAVRSVHQGKPYIDPSLVTPELVEALITHREGREDASGAPPDLLTEREREILALVAEGMTNRQIAHYLGISVKTVEVHRSNIMRKLGLYSQAELVKYAIRHGLTALE